MKNQNTPAKTPQGIAHRENLSLVMKAAHGEYKRKGGTFGENLAAVWAFYADLKKRKPTQIKKYITLAAQTSLRKANEVLNEIDKKQPIELQLTQSNVLKHIESNHKRQLMYVYTFKWNLSVMDAEDRYTDLLMHIYGNFDKFDPARAKFSTFLYFVQRNELIKYNNLNAQQNRKNTYNAGMYSDESTGVAKEFYNHSKNETVETNAIRSEAENMVFDAVGKLKGANQSEVYMYELLGYDVLSTAAEMGITEQDVKNARKRAKEQLEKLLKPVAATHYGYTF